MFKVGNLVRNCRPVMGLENGRPIIAADGTVTGASAWSFEIPENNLFIVTDVAGTLKYNLQVLRLPTLQDMGWQNWLDFELAEELCPISK